MTLVYGCGMTPALMWVAAVLSVEAIDLLGSEQKLY